MLEEPECCRNQQKCTFLAGGVSTILGGSACMAGTVTMRRFCDAVNCLVLFRSIAAAVARQNGLAAAQCSLS